MFGLGFSELIVIFLVIIVVFGPDKLPGLARTLGRTAAQFRRAVDEFKHEMQIPTIDLKKELFDDPPKRFTPNLQTSDAPSPEHRAEAVLPTSTMEAAEPTGNEKK